MLRRASESDESEDERYLKDLLDRVTANDDPADDDDDEELEEEEDLFADDVSEKDFDFKTPEVPGRDTQRSRKRKTEVDDRFFKMADMEEFLDLEDEREERRIARERGDVTNDQDQSDDEDLDYFGEAASGDDDVKQMKVYGSLPTNLYLISMIAGG